MAESKSKVLMGLLMESVHEIMFKSLDHEIHLMPREKWEELGRPEAIDVIIEPIGRLER